MFAQLVAGSSPLTRGARADRFITGVSVRIIPAHAGSTLAIIVKNPLLIAYSVQSLGANHSHFPIGFRPYLRRRAAILQDSGGERSAPGEAVNPAAKG